MGEVKILNLKSVQKGFIEGRDWPLILKILRD